MTESHGASSQDEALVRRVIAGEPGADRALWDQYAPPVRRFIRRAFGPDVDPQDLTQEVFLEVFRRLDRLNKPESLRSFIFAVATNIVRMELRRRRVRALIRLTDSGELPEVRLARADPDVLAAGRRLYRHLDQLRVSERACFVLRHFEGFELTEVAALSGLSLATVKRRLEAASAKLLELVAKDALLGEYIDRLERGEGDRHE
jgi:RNA polymerase sigma-70 factor (ECF subfamily)